MGTVGQYAGYVEGVDHFVNLGVIGDIADTTLKVVKVTESSLGTIESLVATDR